jgi:2-C-methyl-D-erythritol 4-phosphate cytidylyltransferase
MTGITVLPSLVVPKRSPDHVWTIVVAAGSGRRFGAPKQFESLGDRRVMDWAVAVARTASSGGVVVVMPAGQVEQDAVSGGATRSASVRAGLASVPASASIICVHDAARPFASVELFESVIDAVAAGAGGAVPGIEVTDTIKGIDEQGTVVSTPMRSSLRAIQTPQAFRSDLLRLAYASGAEGTDDAALVEAVGAQVVVVPGEVTNRKITLPEDLAWARAKVVAP